MPRDPIVSQELDLSSNLLRVFTVFEGGDLGSKLVRGGRREGGGLRPPSCTSPALKEINLSHNLLSVIPTNISRFAPVSLIHPI